MVTFCSTVLWANRLNDWKTMPTSARSLARALPSSGRATPSMVIEPEAMGSSRLMVRHSVDLPDPDGPMTTSTSPLSTVRSMSLSTWRSPKYLLTLSMTTRGVASAGDAAGAAGVGSALNGRAGSRRRPEPAAR